MQSTSALTLRVAFDALTICNLCSMASQACVALLCKVEACDDAVSLALTH